ncbi:MAG: tetratricopeptide repeat protein [Patescibacteria group bacterium]|jgi:tetratricopeptide (TPR) repeat protein
MAEPEDLNLGDLLELLGDSSTLEPDSCAKAATCLGQNDFAGVLVHCEKALGEDPCNGLAMNLQIHALHKSGQKDQAMAKLSYLMRFFPDRENAKISELTALFSDSDEDTDFYLIQAKTCLEQKRFDDARQYAEDALRINPFSCQANCMMARIYLAQDDFEKAQVQLAHLLKYYGENKQVGYLVKDYIEVMIAKDKFADALIFFVQFKENRSLALSFVGTACSAYAEHQRKAVKEIEDLDEQRLKLAEAEMLFLEAISYLQDSPTFLIQAIEGLLYVYLEWSKKFRDDKSKEMHELLAKAEGLSVRVPPRIYAAFVFFYARKPSTFAKAIEYLVKCREAGVDDEKSIQATRAFLGHLKEHRHTIAHLPDPEMKATRLDVLATTCKEAIKAFDDTEIIAAISVNLLFIYLEKSRIGRSKLSEMLRTLQALEMLVDDDKRRPEMYLPFVYFFTMPKRHDKKQADYFLTCCEQHICSDEREYLEPAYAAYRVAFGMSFNRVDQSK